MEKDPFEGLTGGWWSKGEVLRNKERRELANRGKTVIAGEFQRIESPKQRKWQDNTSNYDDIPAAGYSGHMPGFRQMEIGKSFNTAAREAKRNYAMQRRARSGGREQVAVAYGAENWSDTQLINTQTSLNSSTNDHLKGDQVQSTGKGL